MITIHIEAASAAEARKLMTELLGGTAPAATATAAPAATPAADDGKKGGKKKNETPATTAAAPAATVDPFAPQTTAAPAADPFAAPATAGATAPAAAAPAAASAGAAVEGEVTYDELKKLMTDVLSKKSAAFALDALQKATGHKALTGMPKEMYPKAKAALEAALV